LRDQEIETPETVARRIEAALEVVSMERMIVAPDCGMKYLDRDVAFGKLRNMVLGRNLVLGQVNE
jgi:5-methyltetrahydropteroyltriglutamate--homocysteine methyltransferase